MRDVVRDVTYLAAMSRGVVLWPDEQVSRTVRAIWDELRDHGLPSMADEEHHVPHMSLMVADDVSVPETLAAVGDVPSSPLPLLIESVGVVPGGHLLLTCTATRSLLAEQARVYLASADQAENPWLHYAPDAWLPHLTLGRSLAAAELAVAVPMVLAHLPIQGWLPVGGVEDGTTGERWPTSVRR